MANVLGTLFQDIANAIRAKTGGTGTMKPAEFPAEIASIVTGGSGGDAVIEPLTITKNGTYTAEDGVDGYSPVTVEVAASCGDAEKYFENTYEEVVLPNVTKIKGYAFYSDTFLKNIEMPNVEFIGNYAFYNCSDLALTSLPSGLLYINNSSFSGCTNLALTSLPNGLRGIAPNAFYNCTSLTSITFEGKPNNIVNSAFSNCTNLTTINVPWAEGEVANAPWGATNATINYNYTGE